MKYSQIKQNSFKNEIGIIEVMGQKLQLCDHIESVDGHYYATTFAISTNEMKLLKDHGARFGIIEPNYTAIYLPENLLASASPVDSDDLITQTMISRTRNALTSTNMKPEAYA